MIWFSKEPKMHKIVEMAQITSPQNNLIDGYADLRVYVYGSSETKVNGGKQEHNPPHFYIIHKSGDHILNFTININTLEIGEVYNNRDKDFKIKLYNNQYKWETSGLGDFRKVLIKWLNKVHKAGLTNLTSIKLQWDSNNPSLEQTL